MGGSVLFISFFISRAKVIDASEAALDPGLVQLRGQNPLVLLPITNPDNAESMVFVANALAPPVGGRLLILSIMIPSKDEEDLDKRILIGREVMKHALKASFRSDLRPDALTTIADDPWQEIERVARVNRCSSLLLGLGSLHELETSDNLEKLVQRVDCDVVVFRQPRTGWQITDARKILIPVAGLDRHDRLRARIAASLWRTSHPDITFLQLLPDATSESDRLRTEKSLKRFANRIIPGKTKVRVEKSHNTQADLVREASEHELVIMGLGRAFTGGKAFGRISMAMARETNTALIFISNK